MNPNGSQQQPTDGSAPDGSFQIVGQRRNHSAVPQDAARQQAAQSGRRARSGRSDQPSPNARGGVAQRTHDNSAALSGGTMAMEQVAPAQAAQAELDLNGDGKVSRGEMRFAMLERLSKSSSPIVSRILRHYKIRRNVAHRLDNLAHGRKVGLAKSVITAGGRCNQCPALYTRIPRAPGPTNYMQV